MDARAATIHPGGAGERSKAWAGVEAIVACVLVALDVGIPSFVLLAMALASMAVRRQGWSSLGMTRPDATMAAGMFGFAIVWTLVQMAVTMPVANHLSGREQDLSQFADIEGDPVRLLLMVVLGWTVGAFVEELAYRGYLLTRLRQALGGSTGAVVVAVLVSSALFGRVHDEQGAIGVLVVALDAVVWSVLRHRCRSLAAPMLAHGFNNTIGFVAFYFVGPVHGFW